MNPFRLEFAVHAYSRFYSFKLHIVLAESYMLTAPSEPNQQPYQNEFKMSVGCAVNLARGISAIITLSLIQVLRYLF